MVNTSSASRYTLSRNLSLRLFPQRLYAFRSVPSPADVVIGRLFKLSLQSLRGYLEVKDLSCHTELVTLADVVATQRYAQCRQLAAMVRYIDSTPVTATEEAASLRVIWKKALDQLEQDNLPRFSALVSVAEQRLEYAFLAEANKMECEDIREHLHSVAINIFGVRERLEELTSDFVLEYA